MAVVIISAKINKFRNLTDKEYQLVRSTVFSGRNRLGKTNVLNAIAWCLTGYDIYGNSEDKMNVPFDTELNEGDTCVDVTVELNVGVINRRVIFKGGSYSQALTINGLDCKTLKEGEAQINDILGITDLVLKGSKDFNVRRFLLNPLYFTQCKESAFREFIIKQLINVDTSAAFAALPEPIQKIISTKDAAVASQENGKEIKTIKAQIEYWKVIKDYCTKINKTLTTDLAAAEKVIKQLNVKLADLNDKAVAIDKYALEISKIYNEAVKTQFKGIDIVLLEKGQGEDVWKNTCAVISSITNAKMEYCSTSESILTGCSFICKFATKIKSAPHLPLLLDEFETLDSDSVNALLKKMNTQLVAACVGESDSIQTKHLGE